MMTNKMPRIDMDALKGTLSPEDYEIARRVVASQGKNKGCLRAAKPKVAMLPHPDPERARLRYQVPEAVTGRAAYVWRMVAFTISPVARHHCTPCGADFDLPERNYKERAAEARRLDEVADAIIATVSPAEWHGTRRWAGIF